MRYIAFDAPSANEAYAQAPDLAQEEAAVTLLRRELAAENRSAFHPDVSVPELREVRLRAAAVADRRWWSTRTDEALHAAVRAAWALMEHDRQHGDEVAGPYGPDSIEWDAEGGPRAYVRQEYRHWLTVPPGCADPCPDDAPCPWHGG
ncbi:hypothetical protein ACGF07_35280 [Kitasatospora sp. NPDC048194]|uniref:hypothetical protein n=1 Tax=Kitasatospora sp. NPDC048194 TaxID=3364045 RepID=UPI00371822BB